MSSIHSSHHERPDFKPHNNVDAKFNSTIMDGRRRSSSCIIVSDGSATTTALVLGATTTTSSKPPTTSGPAVSSMMATAATVAAEFAEFDSSDSDTEMDTTLRRIQWIWFLDYTCGLSRSTFSLAVLPLTLLFFTFVYISITKCVFLSLT